MYYEKVGELEEITEEIIKSQKGIKPLDAIKIAVQVQRNIIEDKRNFILAKAFGASLSSLETPYFEAIALQLGYTKKGTSYTISDAISSLKPE